MYDGAPDFPGPDRLWSFVERHRVERSRRLAHADPRAHGPRRRTGSRARPVVAAHPRVDRRAVERRRRGVGTSTSSAAAAARSSTSPVAPRWARASCRRTSWSRCRRARSAVRRSAWRSTCSTSRADPVRGAVGELVCTKPWPGMTRGLYGDPQRYLDTYWSRYPGVWWHGDFASVSDDGQWFLHGRSDDTIKLAGKRLGPAEVETVVVVASDRCSRPPRSACPTSSRARRCGCSSCPGRVSSPTTRSRAELTACVVDAPGTVVQAGASALHRPRCRRRAARRCCGARSGRSSRRVDPGDLSGLEDPAALDAIAIATACRRYGSSS